MSQKLTDPLLARVTYLDKRYEFLWGNPDRSYDDKQRILYSMKIELFEKDKKDGYHLEKLYLYLPTFICHNDWSPGEDKPIDLENVGLRNLAVGSNIAILGPLYRADAALFDTHALTEDSKEVYCLPFCRVSVSEDGHISSARTGLYGNDVKLPALSIKSARSKRATL